MALISWNPSLSVRIEEFDQQHKKLILMINDLSDAMIKRKGNDVLGKILDGLIEYTVIHFRTEEDYFNRYLYPDREAHILEHEKLKKKVIAFKYAFDKGESPMNIEVLKFLSHWLQVHIKGTDKKYVAFLRDKGLR